MGINFPLPELADEIRNFNFHRVAELIRSGDISQLTSRERNLLADYLEGKLKRGRGAPKKPKDEIATNLFRMSEFLVWYGMTPLEYGAWCQENVTSENRKELLKPSKKMTRTRSMEVLADETGMSFDNVKLLVYEGKKIDKWERERFYEEELRAKKECGHD